MATMWGKMEEMQREGRKEIKAALMENGRDVTARVATLRALQDSAWDKEAAREKLESYVDLVESIQQKEKQK